MQEKAVPEMGLGLFYKITEIKLRRLGALFAL